MNADGGGAVPLTDGDEPAWQPLVVPRILTGPRITGTLRKGSPLSATKGGWFGTPTIDYTFQWRRCDRFGSACVDIVDATAATHALVDADVGHTLRVQVLAGNEVGSSEASSAATGTVGDVLVGTAGPDLLVGTAGSDVAYGRRGNDSVVLRAGADFAWGGRGADRLAGGDGPDRLVGGPGHDTFRGGPGRDRITSRDGVRDTVSCGDGRDLVVADWLDVIARGCEIVRR
jgi:hypothetical protein